MQESNPPHAHRFRANPIALGYLRLCLLIPLIPCAQMHWSALPAQYLIALPLVWLAPRLSLGTAVLTLLALPVVHGLAQRLAVEVIGSTGLSNAGIPAELPLLTALWSAGHASVYLLGLTVVIPLESARRARSRA